MQIPQSYIQKCKVTAHVFQALLIFIAGCITLAIFAKDGSTDGRSKYFFAMCFLTVPALIYQGMVPAWQRTVRFANAYALLSLDALYTILWFAAFIAVATWNSAGIRQGAKDAKVKDGEGNCTTFAYGSESKCNLSKATVGFGVIIFILFGLTTAISAYYLVKFRKDGVLPFLGKNYTETSASTMEANTKDAWSTEIGGPQYEGDNDSDDGTRTERGGAQEEDEYALLHSTDTDEGRHPGRPLSWGEDHQRTGSGYGDMGNPYGQDVDTRYEGNSPAANALSPGGYEDYRRTGNYSFN